MPLVKVNDLLRHATENHYGVAAVNVCNYETIKWVAEAAGRERIPVIIQFYPGFEKYIALKHVAAIAKEFAEKSEVPIGVHLDHSAGYGIAVGGVRDGFPSVMVDGSALPYEENVALTAAVVQAGRRVQRGCGGGAGPCGVRGKCGRHCQRGPLHQRGAGGGLRGADRVRVPGGGGGQRPWGLRPDAQPGL